MAQRHGARRRETFYKVQKWNAALSAWTDARKKTFDTLEDAKKFADQSDGKAPVRIVQFLNGRFVELN